MVVEDAEAPGLAGSEGETEVPVDVDDPPALEADEMMMGPGFRVEAGLAAADGQLVDPAVPLEAMEDVVDGRKGHGREAGPERLVDLLGAGMALVPGEISGNRQLLRRPAGSLLHLAIHYIIIFIY
jgi:hypothetical protein